MADLIDDIINSVNPQEGLTSVDTTPDDSSITPQSFTDTFGRGLEVGAAQQTADTDFFQALVQRSIGDEEAADANIRRAHFNEERSATALDNLETFKGFTDNPSLDGFLQYYAKTMGQVSPYFASTIASGLAGGLGVGVAKAGLSLTGRQVANRLLKDSLLRTAKDTATPDERDLAEIAYALQRSTIAQRAADKLSFTGGQVTGMLAEEYKTMAGANYGENLKIDGLDDTEARLRAAGIAIPQALIGVKGERLIQGILTNGLTKVAKQRGTKEGSLIANFAKEIGRGAAKGAPVEMITEASQDALQIASRLQTDPDYTTEEALLRGAESAAAGFLAGGTMGAGGGAVSGAASTTKNIFAKADDFINKTRQAKLDGQIDQEQYGSNDAYVTTAETQQTIGSQIQAMLNGETGRNAVWVAGDQTYNIKTDKEDFKNQSKADIAAYAANLGVTLDPSQLTRKEMIKQLEATDAYKASRSTVDMNGESVFARYIKGKGTILSKDKSIVDAVVESDASDASIAAALGYSSSSVNGGIAIQIKDLSGTVVWEQLTNEEGVDAAYAAAEKQIGNSKGYEISRTTKEQALESKRAALEDESGPTGRFMDTDNILADLFERMRDTSVQEETTQEPPIDENNEAFFGARQELSSRVEALKEENKNLRLETQSIKKGTRSTLGLKNVIGTATRQFTKEEKARLAEITKRRARIKRELLQIRELNNQLKKMQRDYDYQETQVYTDKDASQRLTVADKETRFSVVDDNKGQGFAPRKRRKVYELTKQIRQEFQEVFRDAYGEINFNKGVFNKMSDAVLKKATKLQRENPDTIIEVKQNEDGTFVIEQGILPEQVSGSPIVPNQSGIESDKGLARTLNEAFRQGIRTAAKSLYAKYSRVVKRKDGSLDVKKSILRGKDTLVTITAKGKKPLAVNLRDLIKEGQRMVQAEEKTQFTGASPRIAERNGMFRILSELISREYDVKLGGESLTKSDIDVLTKLEEEYKAWSRDFSKAKKDGVAEEDLPVRPALTAKMEKIVATLDANGGTIGIAKLLRAPKDKKIPGNRQFRLRTRTAARTGIQLNIDKLVAKKGPRKDKLKSVQSFSFKELVKLAEDLNAREGKTKISIPSKDGPRGVISKKNKLYKDIKAQYATRTDFEIYNEQNQVTKPGQVDAEYVGTQEQVAERVATQRNSVPPLIFTVLDRDNNVVVEGDADLVLSPDITKDDGSVIPNEFMRAEEMLERKDDLQGENKVDTADRVTERDTPETGATGSAVTYTGPKIIPTALRAKSMAARVAKVATKALRLKNPVDVLTTEGLLEATPETITALFKDPKVAAEVIAVAKSIRDSKTKRAAYIGFENAHFVLVDGKKQNNLETAYAVGHELGHALFKEQMGDALNNPALNERLYKAHVAAASAEGAPKAYKGRHGFEEWYADQVAITAMRMFYKDEKSKADRETARAQRDKKAVDFVPVVESFTLSDGTKVTRETIKSIPVTKGIVASHFKKLVQSLKAKFDKFSEEMQRRFSKDSLTEEFSDYLTEVLEKNHAYNKQDATQSAGRVASWKDRYRIDRTAAVVNEQVTFANALQKSIANIINSDTFEGVYNLVTSADSRLRKVAGNKVANLFYVRSQDAAPGVKGRLGMLRAIEQNGNKWVNRLEKELGTKLDDTSLEAAFDEAFSSTKTADLTIKEAKIIRQWFSDFHDEYIAPSNTNIKKRDNYSPVVLSLIEVHERSDELVDLIMQAEPETSRRDIEKAVANLVEYQQDLIDEKPVKIKGLDPAKATERALKLTKSLVESEDGLNKLREAGFLETPQVSTLQYMKNIIKRVEWNTHTKDSRGFDILQEEMAKLSRSQQKEANLIIEKYLGYNTKPLSPMWRNVQSVLQVMQIFAILPLAVLGSIPELAGPVIASKEFGALTTGMKQTIKTGLNREQARQMALEIGVTASQTTANVLMSQSEMDWMHKRARKVTDAFFRVILLDTYTKFTREYAVNMGVKFLQRHGNPETAVSKSPRYLKELGVTPKQIDAWIKSDQDFSTPEGKAVEQALRRFTESATLRPNAAERPVWASDPHYAIFWQLKGFFYSYGKVMLAGAKREAGNRLQEAQIGGAEGATLAAAGGVASVFALMGIATLPLAMVGMELRELAKYGLAWGIPGIDPDDKNYFRTDDMSIPAYLSAAFNRSFAAGPVSIGAQALQAADWGRGPVGAASVILGPSAETAERMFTDGFSSTFKNRILPTGLL